MTEESLALPLELLGSIERYAVYRCYSALLDENPAISIKAAAEVLGRGRDTLRPIIQALRGGCR